MSSVTQETRIDERTGREQVWIRSEHMQEGGWWTNLLECKGCGYKGPNIKYSYVGAGSMVCPQCHHPNYF